MLKDMASWYQMAELLPSAETAQARTTASEAFGQWLPTQPPAVIAECVQMCFHPTREWQETWACVEQLTQCLVDADSEFDSEYSNVDMCLRACALACLDELVNTNKEIGLIISALCVAGYTDMVLDQEPNWIHVPRQTLYKSSISQLEGAGFSKRKAKKRSDAANDIGCLAEELDVLWWHKNGFSDSIQRFYSELAVAERPYWLALDLASIIQVPSVQALRNLLANEAKALAPSSYLGKTLGQAVKKHRTNEPLAVATEEISKLVTTHPRLFPVLNYCGANQDASIERRLSDMKLFGQQWALQVFNEAVALKMIMEAPK